MVTEGADNDTAIERLYLAALSRYPTADERRTLGATMAGPGGNGAAITASRRRALEDLVWAVLTGKEFLFNH
jgi:hypothetical protein